MKFLALLIIVILGLAACGDRPTNKRQGRMSAERAQRLKQTVSFAPGYEKRQKEEYETRLEAILNGYLRSIEELRSQGRKRGMSKDKEWEPMLAALEVKAEAVGKTLERLRGTSMESWQDLKPGVHAALDDLETSYEKALAGVGRLDNPASPPLAAPEPVHVHGTRRVVPTTITSKSK